MATIAKDGIETEPLAEATLNGSEKYRQKINGGWMRKRRRRKKKKKRRKKVRRGRGGRRG
jgi:hypothetical protein